MINLRNGPIEQQRSEFFQVAAPRLSLVRRARRFIVYGLDAGFIEPLVKGSSHDKTGPLAGVPYDGTDPAYGDLYHALPKDYDFAKGLPQAMSRDAPDFWKQLYFKRIKEIVDNYQPDLFYTDGGIPFEGYGLSLVAHLYNSNAKRHGGTAEAVYTSKTRQDCQTGTCVLDLERGVAGGIPENPWQTDTCIGEWHYNKTAKYKTPKTVIDMLCDIVSRNGASAIHGSHRAEQRRHP